MEYARTFGFSEQVAADRLVLASTQVAFPADLDRGPTQRVVANGIASSRQSLVVGIQAFHPPQHIIDALSDGQIPDARDAGRQVVERACLA